MKDTAKRLVNGNLAELENGLEEYLEGLDQAMSASDLVTQSTIFEKSKERVNFKLSR